jgi:hypothetical protein
LYISDERILEIEYVYRDDWEGISDPCPECHAIEFDHVRYDGGHYGHYQGAVIERRDYWYQKGSLYTGCRGCGEILFKHPAYDIIEQWTEKLQDGTIDS